MTQSSIQKEMMEFQYIARFSFVFVFD